MTTPPAPSLSIPAELDARLDELARTPHVLIACDYDGTLSPIVENPEDARPLREAVVALNTLTEQANTSVAVVSGRSLADLASMLSVPDSVHLVGSHGSEYDVGFLRSLKPEQTALRERLEAALREIAGTDPGLTIECKPGSVALHYRNAEAAAGRQAARRVEEGPALWEGVTTKRGKMVVELAVFEANKGTALDTLRKRVGAHAVVFLGDDVTDEDAFAMLRGPDVGVKVGPGESLAGYRVQDPRDVAQLLARFAERRALWLSGGDAVPIDHHAVLSDLRTCALVTPGARIVWMCAPRLDSPSIFAELLGGPSGGYFSVEPADGSAATRQRYIDRSMVARTDFNTFSVTDFLDCSGGRPEQRPGRSDLIRVLEGTGEVIVRFAPRLDYSRTPTRLALREDGLELPDAPDPIVLRAPGVEWTIVQDGPHDTAEARIALGSEPFNLSLRFGVGTLRASAVNASRRSEITAEYWRSWADRLELPSRARPEVERSALALKALVHGPSGAIAAAATTSLPEEIGGIRNWDYRYCWPRDAAIAATALAKLGSLGEGMRLLDWLLAVVEHAPSPDRISPLYTLAGEDLTMEGEISELSGYAGSRPVRVGNAAAQQVQLDVFGPIVDLVHELALRDAPLTPQHWRVVESMVQAVSSRWHEPDHGIWELRAARRHHVHSKSMCWLTVDRAIRTGHLLHDRVPENWNDLRARIAHDVIEHGWDEHAQAYTSAYDSSSLDAAALWIGLSGLLPPADQRFVRTVEAVERELLDRGGVYRYRYDDGLPGFEGVFHICTTWLILAQLRIGRIEDANALFEQYLGMLGPTGLMCEEMDVNTNTPLGNHPQAYSHAGLIECALALGSAPGSGSPSV